MQLVRAPTPPDPSGLIGWGEIREILSRMERATRLDVVADGCRLTQTGDGAHLDLAPLGDPFLGIERTTGTTAGGTFRFRQMWGSSGVAVIVRHESLSLQFADAIVSKTNGHKLWLKITKQKIEQSYSYQNPDPAWPVSGQTFTFYELHELRFIWTSPRDTDPIDDDTGDLPYWHLHCATVANGQLVFTGDVPARLLFRGYLDRTPELAAY